MILKSNPPSSRIHAVFLASVNLHKFWENTSFIKSVISKQINKLLYWEIGLSAARKRNNPQIFVYYSTFWTLGRGRENDIEVVKLWAKHDF